ncbi:alkaline phosphatase [bacterium]|nr:alkaline phosphatase [bacterium]
MTQRWYRAATVAALVALIAAAGCGGGAAAPKNIIFLIGDGMGVTHVTAAKVALGELEMERLPICGLQTTFPTGEFITDSAASGTALATGTKTTNGSISVTPDMRPLKSVLEYAEEREMATGLVATSSITHATPAVFASHVDSRDKEIEIAAQMAMSGVDVLIGGGAAYFLPMSEPGGLRRDSRNLLIELSERATVVRTASELVALENEDAVIALLAAYHLPIAPERPLPLAVITSKAIEFLSRDDDGFFLMVEGSQIDWAGHENDKGWLLDEMADFDEAVGAAMDFAERNGETLVIVTADHECGGMSLIGGSVQGRKVTEVRWGSDLHTSTMVPVFAYGPGSERFGGIMDNTAIGSHLVDIVSGQ